MSVTATELKNNLSFYLKIAESEDVFITKNGRVIAKLTNPNQNRVDLVNSLLGVIPSDMTLEEAVSERRDLI